MTEPTDRDGMSIRTKEGTSINLSGDTTREIVGAFTQLVQSSISNDPNRGRGGR